MSGGRLATATDPLARSTQFQYDAADRLTRQVLPDGREVGYGYAAAGNLTSVTPPGRPAHTFQYNAVNLATEYRPPTVDAADPATSYAYDLDRALTQVRRPDGITVDFTYDAAGRASQVTFPGGLLEYGYDASTGQLTGINGPYGSALSMAYDGSLLTGMQWIGEVAGSVGAAYDDDFRVRELRVNGAGPVTFGYDGDGLLLQAGALSAARDAASGRLTGTTLGSLTSAQSYTGFGELSGLTWTHGGTDLYATTYTRDALGRIATKTEMVGAVTTTWSYSYDLTGRLTQVDRDGVTEEAYAYDPNGNRTSLTNAGGVITATYDAQDRLLTYGAKSYTYTANGELTAKIEAGGTTSYAYDPLGNLLGVDLPDGTAIDYVVDPVGRRIGRKVGGVLQQGWLYQDGLNPIAELDGTGAVVSRFVYGTRANVPDYMVKGGVTYRIVSDELGSVRLVVDVATGAVAQELAYDAWGRVLVDTNPGFQPFGYAGGLYDPLTGLVRFGARDYDAEVGRWTAKDPVGFGGGDGNLYGYGWNDPLNHVDPSGLLTECCRDAILALMGQTILDASGLRSLVMIRKFGKVGRFLKDYAQRMGERGLWELGGRGAHRAGREALQRSVVESGKFLHGANGVPLDVMFWGGTTFAAEPALPELSALPAVLFDLVTDLVPGVGSLKAFFELVEACEW